MRAENLELLIFFFLALGRWNSFQESGNQGIHCGNQVSGGENKKAGKPKTDTRKEDRPWFRQRETLEREAGESNHQQQSSWSTTQTSGRNISQYSIIIFILTIIAIQGSWKKVAAEKN